MECTGKCDAKFFAAIRAVSIDLKLAVAARSGSTEPFFIQKMSKANFIVAR